MLTRSPAEIVPATPRPPAPGQWRDALGPWGALRRQQVRSISVVTVCYNARDCIRLTLDSVKRQTFPNIEHVIIDGGSNDGTQDIVREFDVAYFVSEPDKGIYDAMEKGARAARGDILIFLNAGDLFYDRDVCADVAKFFPEAGADFVFGNLLPAYLRPSDSHDHSAFRPGQLLDLSYFSNRRRIYSESIHHQATFYRRWIFSKCSYYSPAPEANGEYNVLMSAVLQHNAVVKHIPRPISRFMLGGESTKNYEEEWRRYSAARDALRRIYCPDPARIPMASETEFRHTPVEPLGLQIRKGLKRAIKASPPFKIYDRLAHGLSMRAASAVEPRLATLVEMLDQATKRMSALEAQMARRGAETDRAIAHAAERITGDVGGYGRELANSIRASTEIVSARIDNVAEHANVALAEISARTNASDDFADHGFRGFSQWDEDGLIQFLLSRLPAAPQTFIEIGVSDYTEANTRLLVVKDNWRGALIECDGESVKRIKADALYWRHSLHVTQSFVTAENVNDLIKATGLAGEIGLLSLDIDGMDYWVWKTLDAASPQIMICEYNGLLGDQAPIVVPYDPMFDRTKAHYSWLYAGASLPALIRLGKEKGYTFIGTNLSGNNSFFVRDDVFSKSGLKASRRQFVRPLFREARTPEGALSFLDAKDAIQLIAAEKFVDLRSGAISALRDIPGAMG